MIYFQDERHEFNCELEWDSNLLIRPLVLCNMQGNSSAALLKPRRDL